MKVKNIQDMYTRQQFAKVSAVRRTYETGYSPVALNAPEQVSRCMNMLRYDFPFGVSSSEEIYTLKLYYALNVWRMSLAILQEKETRCPGQIWDFGWEENGTPFRRLCFKSPQYAEKVQDFWRTLQNVADSGVVKVSEGAFLNEAWKQNWYRGENTLISVNTLFVIDAADVGTIEVSRRKQEKSLYLYPFSKKDVSYSWNEIKDFFVELTLEEIALLQEEEIHRKQSVADKKLFDACRCLNIRKAARALKGGAYINSLDEHGNSAITVCLEAVGEWNCQGREPEWKELMGEIKKKEPAAQKIISYLLKQGADINLFGFGGSHPLVQCYFADSIALMEFLLQKGAEPNYNEHLTDLNSRGDKDIISAVLYWTWDCFDIEPERLELYKAMEQLLLRYGAKGLLKG